MKLYVGNLNFNLSNDDLKTKFEEFGAVISANIIMDRETGRSKGFAFVEMNDSASGQEAISQLNGQEFEGRRVIVNEARPRPEGGQRSSGGNRGGFNRDRNDRGDRGGSRFNSGNRW